MKTSKPIKELIPDILDHIQNQYEGQVQYNAKLIDIYEGQLLKYVIDSLRLELNPKSFERAKERVSPINVLRKIVEKQARTYEKPASRAISEGNDVDKEVLAYYEESCDLDANLQYASELLELNKYVALEPYVAENKAAVRVLTAAEFLPYSDSKVNPHEMTVFIKFMGKKHKLIYQVDNDGRVLEDKEALVKEVSVFQCYSEDEYVKIDSDGDIEDYVQHNLGKIPFVYVKKTKNKLIPTPDSDNYAMAVLIPKLISDLNYAVQFLSHSKMYVIDAKVSKLDGNPDSLWTFKTDQNNPNSKPQIGAINPQVDTEKVMKLVSDQILMWLDTKGLKTGNVGQVEASASGIAKAIDEADATSIRQKQLLTWADAEMNFWSLITLLHSEWTKSNRLTQKSFSTNVEIETTFQEQKPVINKLELLNEIEKEQKLGLTTPEISLRKYYPDKTDEEIQELLTKIEEHKASQKPDIPDPTNTIPQAGEEQEEEPEQPKE